MKPPFQYPRRAEADNFRTKVKLVRSAFRSPRSIAVGSHQPRRGPALLVNGFSSAATAHLNRFWSSEVPNHKQCHGPKPGLVYRLRGGEPCSFPCVKIGFSRLPPFPAGAGLKAARSLRRGFAAPSVHRFGCPFKRYARFICSLTLRTG